jgi:hypothetical protein
LVTTTWTVREVLVAEAPLVGAGFDVVEEPLLPQAATATSATQEPNAVAAVAALPAVLRWRRGRAGMKGLP